MASNYWANINSVPKRQHRFLFKFGKRQGENSEQLPMWVCSRVTRPSMEITSIEHQYLNYTFKYPGRAKWNNISVTLRDPGSPDATKVLYEWLVNSGYTPPMDDPSSAAAGSTFTKKAFGDLFGIVTIETLDAKGGVVDEWKIHNPMIVSVNWGELDYSSEELLNITVDLAYDYATIEGVKTK